ncbi:hypothetical protein FQU23_015935 [Flavobacterium sp. XN-5]|uniref:hypothetical protein n=1 Tax=Flavobacterium sp. XN-5 TaxID=2599390 RepID=UPI0011CC5BBC|nr:hypothetical protein [Flavobacterium sp. XN-5]NGY38987.1 hypothetical protein [Flavobacterium sp. XN-5]
MNELIGFKNINRISDINQLKRELLLFDKLFIVGYNEYQEVFHDRGFNNTNELLEKKGLIPLNDFIIYQGYIFMKEKINELGGVEKYYETTKTPDREFRNQNLEYLFEQGKLISDYSKLEKNSDYHKTYSKFSPLLEQKIKLSTERKIDDYFDLCNLSHDLKTRIVTSSTKIQRSTLITCESSIYNVESLTPLKEQVYNLILEDFPIIEVKNLSWEQIFDFKSDPESYNSIWSLRNWISKISSSAKNISEIEEEYRELKYKYEQSIKIHKLKTSSSVFQTTIQTGAELLENIARLKFSKVADLLFKFRENQISLMENELKAEGNQLSYLFKMKELN